MSIHGWISAWPSMQKVPGSIRWKMAWKILAWDPAEASAARRARQYWRLWTVGQIYCKAASSSWPGSSLVPHKGSVKEEPENGSSDATRRRGAQDLSELWERRMQAPVHWQRLASWQLFSWHFQTLLSWIYSGGREGMEKSSESVGRTVFATLKALTGPGLVQALWDLGKRMGTGLIIGPAWPLGWGWGSGSVTVGRGPQVQKGWKPFL